MFAADMFVIPMATWKAKLGRMAGWPQAVLPEQVSMSAAPVLAWPSRPGGDSMQETARELLQEEVLHL